MPQYPQTPVEFVHQAVEEAKRRGASPSMIDPVIALVERGSWDKAREVVDLAIRRTPDACSNLRTKLSWAHNWSQGRLPGTMQADLDNHTYSPDDVRDAWLEVISGGKYEPPRPDQETSSSGETVVVTVDDPADAPKAAKPASNAEPVPRDTSTARYQTPEPVVQHSDPDHQPRRRAPPAPKVTGEGVELAEGDDYADIQDAINKGIL